jgi:hypothetical protein
MKHSGPAAVLFPLPTQEELAAMSEGEALNYLGEELASPVFVEKLLEDEAAFASVEDFLETTMGGSAEPESRKRAAALYAALLHQDPGSLDFADEAAVVDFLQALLPDIIPAGALASRQAFEDPFAAGTPLQNILDAAGISL